MPKPKTRIDASASAAAFRAGWAMPERPGFGARSSPHEPSAARGLRAGPAP
jgi:hypothetical protein